MGNNKLVMGLVAGAIVGVAAGILLAPKAGKETRQMVRTRASNLIGYLRQKLMSPPGPETLEHSTNGAQTVDAPHH